MNEAKFNLDALMAGGGGERKAGASRKNWSPIKGANRMVMLMAKDAAKASQARRRSSLAASPPSRRNASCATGGARRASCDGMGVYTVNRVSTGTGGSMFRAFNVSVSAGSVRDTDRGEHS